MKQAVNDHKTTGAAPSLWKSIVLVIVLAFGFVALFGAIIFLLLSGAQRLGLSTIGYLAIFVFISGVFAWLVKRISDTASGLSHLWFPEEPEEHDQGNKLG
jgi:hypothetical protein